MIFMSIFCSFVQLHKFLRRFKKTEELAFKDGKNLKELSAKEIDRYYNESKKG